ncbi:MAG: hypothetical protein ACFFB3_01815 [Candidatus Hodarchaeota archaeon]
MKIIEFFQRNHIFGILIGLSFICVITISLLTINFIFLAPLNDNGEENGGNLDNFKEFVEFEGTMFASDAGVAFGGFEWTATYIATWNISRESQRGFMNLTLDVGLGSHFVNDSNSIALVVANFVFDGSHVNFSCESGEEEILYIVSMDFIENDIIWSGQYNNQFIGSHSLNSSERRGLISPRMIPGFIDSFYLELRLEPTDDLSLFNNCSSTSENFKNQFSA